MQGSEDLRPKDNGFKTEYSDAVSQVFNVYSNN